MKKSVFKGVATALVTPFKKDMSVDYKAFEKLVDIQVESRVNALVVAGTTGEGSTLSDEEKEKLLCAALNHADSLPVIAAVTGNDTLKVARASMAAQNVGAAACLIITPYYNKTSDNGLIRHFFTVADSVDIPIIVYNVPSRTGLDISPIIYKKLAEHPNIVGVKEADGDIKKDIDSISVAGDRLKFYSGDDKTMIPFIACGGSGVISVLSNVIPKSVVEVYRAFSSGNTSFARDWQISNNGLIGALFSETNPIPVKYALYRMGLIKNILRLPLVGLGRKNAARIDKLLKERGLKA